MRRSVLAAGVVAVVAVVAGAFTTTASATATATATAIKECGNFGWIEDEGRTGWTYGPIDGAGIFNVTTRKVRCRYARRFVRSWDGQVGSDRHRRFRCRYVSEEYEYADIRCTRRGGKVIRWQTGA